MVGRQLVVFVVFLLLVSPAFAVVTVDRAGVFLEVPEQTGPNSPGRSIAIVVPVPDNEHYRRATIEYDVTVDDEWDDRIFNMIGNLRQNREGGGYYAYQILGRNDPNVRKSIIDKKDGDADRKTGFPNKENTKYHVTMVLDAEAGTLTVTWEEGGNVFTHTAPLTYTDITSAGHGLHVTFGADRGADCGALGCAYVPPYGWKFENLHVELEEGGPFGIQPGGSGSEGDQGGEYVELYRRDGLFFTPSVENPLLKSPHIASSGTPFRKLKVNLDFSFDAWRTDKQVPHEYYLAQLFTTPDGLPKSGGESNGIWLLGATVRRSTSGPGLFPDTVCAPEGPEKLIRNSGWGPGDYHIEMILDGDTHEALYTVTKNGAAFTTGSFSCPELTRRPEFPYYTLAEVLSDGVWLRLGRVSNEGDYHLIPLDWRYSNLLVEGVRGTPQDSGGSSVIFEELATPFIPDTANPTRRYDISMSPGLEFSRVIVDLDVTPGPRNPGDPGGLHNLFWLHRGNRGAEWANNIVGYVNARNGNARLTHSIDAGGQLYGEDGSSWGFVEGQRYHIQYVYDTAGSVSASVDGNTVFQGGPTASVVRSTSSRTNTPGFFIQLGLEENLTGPEVPTYGWKYENLRVEFVPGSSSGGSGGPLSARDASGYTPDETDDGTPVELTRANGVFFTQPWPAVTCGTSNPGCGGEHWVNIPAGEAYEKIIVNFDFTTEDLLRAGYYQMLARLENQCTRSIYWDFLVKHPNGGLGRSVLNVRGNGDQLYGELGYQENTQYHAEMVYDFLDQEVYTTISGSNGNLLHTVGDRINSDLSNLGKVESTQDGFNLIFGSHRSQQERITGQPHLWRFANLVVEGVPLGTSSGGGPIDPGAADLSTDDGRLAFLAANMITIAEDDDYTLDCGPMEDVLNTPPSSGDEYCVLQYRNKIAFGTFTSDESDVLDSFKDPFYEGHIAPSDIDENACDSVDITNDSFQECDDAIEGFHTYGYYDDGVMFLVFSKDTVDVWDTTLLEALIDFFRRLFGVDSPEGGVTGVGSLPLKRFHHGYFSHDNDRDVAATWLDDDARVIYRGFITNFSVSKPEDAEHALGLDKQVLQLELDQGSPSDVQQWQTLTAALRIGDVPGAPIEGDYCGNDVLGFEEQCEPNIPVGTCQSLFPSLSSQDDVGCFPPGDENECRYDISPCLGTPISGCYDDWIPTPIPDPCAGASPDPACPSSGGGPGPNPCSGVTCDPGWSCNRNTGQCVEDPGGPEPPPEPPTDLGCGQLWNFYECDTALIAPNSCGCATGFLGPELGYTTDCNMHARQCCLPTGTTHDQICDKPLIVPTCTTSGGSCGDNTDCCSGLFCNALDQCVESTCTFPRQPCSTDEECCGYPEQGFCAGTCQFEININE